MAESKLGFQVWILAIYLLTTGIKGTSSMKLHRDLGVTQKTAWHLAHRIRAMWQVGDFRLAGPVEADETYIGGKESNKHESKKSQPGRWLALFLYLVRGESGNYNEKQDSSH